MIRHVRMGRVVETLVRGFPSLLLTATIQPITRTVLKVRLTILPDFEWSDKIHGMTSDPWWIWVEDSENNQMYHSEYFMLQRKQVRALRPVHTCIIILLYGTGVGQGAAGPCIHHPDI